ncbi:MAG: hypothetical protein FWF22_06165 [Treponema sp.]|nr:hypothetical protein [Treponema sp.]
MRPEISCLRLVSPILYFPDSAADPFNYSLDQGEMIFCFEIPKMIAAEFEPEKRCLPGDLIFSGSAVNKNPGKAGQTAGLPQGNYFFTQLREISDKEKIIWLMTEVQQEILWQRLIPESKCYLRYLFEDRCGVTQIFRPFAETAINTGAL